VELRGIGPLFKSVHCVCCVFEFIELTQATQ
jgi:hypothetical protein